VIVTQILTHPGDERQPSKAISREDVERKVFKINALFVTFLFGAQDLMQRLGLTRGRSQDEREPWDMGSSHSATDLATGMSDFDEQPRRRNRSDPGFAGLDSCPHSLGLNSIGIGYSVPRTRVVGSGAMRGHL
jgi:hypothetical protein